VSDGHIPQGTALNATDLDRLTHCGIPLELASQAMLRRVTSQVGAAVIGKKNGSGDYAGILFPYVWPGESYIREYRLRRDRPELEAKPGGGFKERAKYLSPPGRSSMLYFVPGTAAEWLTDSSLPIVITEGEKKSLSLWQLAHHGLGDTAENPRWLPIALPGVWNWRGVIEKRAGPDGSRRDVKGVIPDIERITWKHRKVVVLFDANAAGNDSVQRARDGLTRELRQRGAELFWFAWPDDTPQGVNGIDDLIGIWGPERVLDLILKQQRPVKITDSERRASPRDFVQLADDRYRLVLPGIGVVLDVDRLRREHHELMGELCVRCDLPGARTVDGTLSIADFNLSSARARSERAKLLADRANTRDLDWPAVIEEFCQRVLQADRAGQPATDLRLLPKPERDKSTLDVDGFALPRNHPSILRGSSMPDANGRWHLRSIACAASFERTTSST
jgi:hypothetical protein